MHNGTRNDSKHPHSSSGNSGRSNTSGTGQQRSRKPVTKCPSPRMQAPCHKDCLPPWTIRPDPHTPLSKSSLRISAPHRFCALRSQAESRKDSLWKGLQRHSSSLQPCIPRPHAHRLSCSAAAHREKAEPGNALPSFPCSPLQAAGPPVLTLH